MKPERMQAVVIGGGVIGCAASRALAARRILPWVLEQGPRIAEGVTSRNSGVIHAGLYYKVGSLKSKTCIRGKDMLVEWCGKNQVPHRIVGKWIVGVRDEEAELEALLANAVACGASGVRRATLHELREAIPGTPSEVALFSAETGIVDPFELCVSLRKSAENLGAQFLMDTKVQGLEALPSGGYQVQTSRGAIEAEIVVNAGGLFSDEIASLAGIPGFALFPCRGDYFRLSSRLRFTQLIYPIKKRGSPGLGIHLTVGLNGECRLGPDAEYVSSKEDFSSREGKLDSFFEAARRYLPGLRREDLRYDSCGIRPKLRGPGDPEELDFIVSQCRPGLVNMIGIESPGLTAALALAEHAVGLL